MSDFYLQPEVTRDGERVTYRSRIEFRTAPSSRLLLDQLRGRGAGQVIQDDEARHANLHLILERHVCYASQIEDCAILELSYFGSRTEEYIVKTRHDLMVPAHLRSLAAIAVFSRLL